LGRGIFTTCVTPACRIHHFGHNLRSSVIGEVAQTAEQVNLLVGMKCDRGQGNLFSEAVEANKLEFLLEPIQVQRTASLARA
jgi:EAL domain-containing protein (putative c-di-GMP-specific phosphodiesterase class I)